MKDYDIYFFQRQHMIWFSFSFDHHIHICRCHTHIETYYTWCLNTTSILKCAVCLDMYSRQQYGQSLIVWSTLSSIGIHALATLIKHCSSRPCFSLQGIAAHFPSLITVNTTVSVMWTR